MDLCPKNITESSIKVDYLKINIMSKKTFKFEKLDIRKSYILIYSTKQFGAHNIFCSLRQVKVQIIVDEKTETIFLI